MEYLLADIIYLSAIKMEERVEQVEQVEQVEEMKMNKHSLTLSKYAGCCAPQLPGEASSEGTIIIESRREQPSNIGIL